MSTDFWIQASCPQWLKQKEFITGATIDEAIEAAFPRETEDAIIVWRHVYIPLSYKYDVGIILLDVIRMVRELLASESGEWQVDWPSNTFGCRWHFRWEGECLIVTSSEWRSVVGGTEELLRGRPILRIGKSEFVFEWKALLERVRDALVGAGFTSSALPELEGLIETERAIAEYGVLYRRGE